MTTERQLDNFFAFRVMWSTTIVKIVYAAGFILTTIVGLVMLLSAMVDWWIALVILIPGNIFWRLTCEWSILSFKVHDLLVSIDDSLKQSVRKGD